MHSIIPYALLFLKKNNQILLVQRAANVSFGGDLYSLVGGKLEPNETFRQAIVREAFEEIGIAIQEDDLVFIHAFYRKGIEHELVAFIFAADKWQGQPSNKEPEKHSDLSWFDINNLPENILPAHKGAIECIKRQNYYSEYI